MRRMTKRPGWTASMVLAAAVVAGSLPVTARPVAAENPALPGNAVLKVDCTSLPDEAFVSDSWEASSLVYEGLRHRVAVDGAALKGLGVLRGQGPLHRAGLLRPVAAVRRASREHRASRSA